MMFRNGMTRNGSTLMRGNKCLFRSTEATYMGSFKNEGDKHWNHMLLVQSVMAGKVVVIEEFMITTQDTRDISFKAMQERHMAENQMQLC